MLKRTMDVLIGGLLALAVTPVVLLLAFAVMVQFRTSPFFVQHRLGRHGRTFRIIKLRTLPPAAPAYADKYALREVAIPPLCSLLRRLHLDELPQLWLVPFGRMSLVGPRPEMAFLHEQLPPHVAEQRARVRPGCTGLWQISTHASGLIHEHPEYDGVYVDHATLRFDLWIMWHTVLVLLGSPREITLDRVPAWVGARTATPAVVPARTRRPERVTSAA